MENTPPAKIYGLAGQQTEEIAESPFLHVVTKTPFRLLDLRLELQDSPF